MSGPKELDYFSDDRVFARGAGWYESQFRTDLAIRGESSPNYAKRHLFPAAAGRIRQLLPDARLIYLVRHPVDRFLSNYVQSVAAGFERRSIDDLFRAGDRNFSIMFDTGRYMYQLEAYLEHFRAGQILVMRTEDLEAQHCATMEQVLDFIGAGLAGYPDDAPARFHESGDKKALRNWAAPLAAFGRPGRAVLRRLPALAYRPIARPQLGREHHQHLMERYRDDIERLERFTGRSMQWA